ncbi:MAG: hypothetical protein LC104_13995 [Bacteroidales bacterium]|nr:hypothetical protein [Bacteroidales bacterium]
MVAPVYSILIPEETLSQAGNYLQSLRISQSSPGERLRQRLQHVDLQTISTQQFFGELLDTKLPQIFAESAVSGDGSDWNLTELGILGDVSVAVPVTIFDNGNYNAPMVHTDPFPGTLIFTPGALLRCDSGPKPADWDEVTGPNHQINPEGYYQLYRRRLLPVFRYVNHHAHRPRSVVLTIPGLGCGQFAGPFRGQLGQSLQTVLTRFLQENGAAFPNLKAVYYDPYSTCVNARHEIHGISFMVRPLTAPGNQAKSQLCPPSAYAEDGDDFSDCSLCSIVAWDHVSWPGNDFFLGSRATDDGVKAAATNSMAVLTGVAGVYDPSCGKYQPPKAFHNWKEVVQQNGLRLWNPAAVWPTIEV